MQACWHVSLNSVWLPEVPVPGEQVEHLRHLFQARESPVGMLVQLKNMAHASPVRSGYAMKRSAFASPRTRGRMAKLENLTMADRQIIEMTLRQMTEVGEEVKGLEAQIISRGICFSSVDSPADRHQPRC
jgi:transposase